MKSSSCLTYDTSNERAFDEEKCDIFRKKWFFELTKLLHFGKKLQKVTTPLRLSYGSCIENMYINGVGSNSNILVRPYATDLFMASSTSRRLKQSRMLPGALKLMHLRWKLKRARLFHNGRIAHRTSVRYVLQYFYYCAQASYFLGICASYFHGIFPIKNNSMFQSAKVISKWFQSDFKVICNSDQWLLSH